MGNNIDYPGQDDFYNPTGITYEEEKKMPQRTKSTVLYGKINFIDNYVTNCQYPTFYQSNQNYY